MGNFDVGVCVVEGNGAGNDSGQSPVHWNEIAESMSIDIELQLLGEHYWNI